MSERPPAVLQYRNAYTLNEPKKARENLYCNVWHYIDDWMLLNGCSYVQLPERERSSQGVLRPHTRRTDTHTPAQSLWVFQECSGEFALKLARSPVLIRVRLVRIVRPVRLVRLTIVHKYRFTSTAPNLLDRLTGRWMLLDASNGWSSNTHDEVD